MKISPGYCFDDVLLVPKFSEIDSRKNVDLSVDLGKGVNLTIPVVSANMTHVTGPAMAQKITQLGGLPILHRFYNDPLVDSPKMFKLASAESPRVGCSVGVQKADYKLVDKLVDVGCNIICVDVAHGDSELCTKMVSYIAKYNYVLIIAGNVATRYGALRLHDAGADVIKTGVGGGSLCTTRIETGNGVPQLTALEEVFSASKTKWDDDIYSPRKFKIISDGGIRRAGDIVKALCFSDCVMIGNLLAGTDEAPGDPLVIDGLRYKQYAGSSTHKSNHVEGVSALVPCKGPVRNIINQLMEGVRSGLSYQGCSNLESLKNDPEFISISNAGLIESHPHDVLMK